MLCSETSFGRYIQRMVLETYVYQLSETYVYQLSAVCQSFYLPHGHISRG